jgi:two-component system sensor histidine kinase BarA
LEQSKKYFNRTSLSRTLDRLLLILGVLGLLLSFAPLESTAQSVSEDTLQLGPPESIADVRMDADGDMKPDRTGDTVTVAGRIAAARGRLALPITDLIALQDSTGGVHVLLPEGPTLQRGDSIHVRGVVEQAYGLTQLQGLDYRSVDGPSRSSTALPLTVTAAAAERYEGQLVRIQARLVAKGSNEGGDFLYLTDRRGETSAQLTVFVANRHKGRFQLDRFGEGDKVNVTGVLGQHDFDPPYTDYYQVEPRTPDDLALSGEMSPYVRTLLYVLAGGGLIAVVAVFVLRTAVRRRTEELAESRARFQRLAEVTTEGVALHEAGGEIIDANAALADMRGTVRENLIGRNVAEVLPDEVTGEVRDADPHAKDTIEAEFVQENGQTTPVEIEDRKVTVGGEVVHVCAVRDITKRKEWEAEILRAKEEAEQMSRLKSTLLNNMSHELRTPITNITGYAELIMEEADDPHKKFAANICKSGKRLSETLQSVLDMAQIEAGTISVSVQEVTVANVVQEVLNWHDQKIGDAITVDVDVPETCTLRTDRTLLYRILNNLTQNAIKFTEEGTIEVETTATDVGIRIVVRDTGVGIAPEFRPDLFEPFKQESEGWTREFEGTGLGLTLTKHMVELLEGSIEVESTKGEGSVFTVDLPNMTEMPASRVGADASAEAS